MHRLDNEEALSWYEEAVRFTSGAFTPLDDIIKLGINATSTLPPLEAASATSTLPQLEAASANGSDPANDVPFPDLDIKDNIGLTG